MFPRQLYILLAIACINPAGSRLRSEIRTVAYSSVPGLQIRLLLAIFCLPYRLSVTKPSAKSTHRPL